MRSKVNFGHPKIKKKLKIRIDLKWPEIRSEVNLGHPKWLPAAILKKRTFTKKLSE